MSDATPVIPCAKVLEIGHIPVEGRPDEPYAMLISFPNAEHLRAALVAMKVHLSFMEVP